MRKEKKRYSLQRRIMLFYLVPLFALLSVLFIYIKAYRSNVETLAEATFQNLAATKHQQLEENFQKIGFAEVSNLFHRHTSGFRNY